VTEATSITAGERNVARPLAIMSHVATSLIAWPAEFTARLTIGPHRRD
jgi:hypothetical protein